MSDEKIELNNNQQNSSDDELAKARREAEEYLSGWKRAKADYLNLKKDMEKERELLARFANQSLIEELLPILENFCAAWLARGEAEKTPWAEGVGHIKKQLEDVLKNVGVEEIKGEGELFDPMRHETVGKEKAPEGVAPLTVLKIIRSGYTLHGKVIKPAQVIVAE